MPERAPDFVYVIYIAANPDKVWNGLIDRELTKAYWEHYNVSDWKRDSRWEHVRSDGSARPISSARLSRSTRRAGWL